MRTPRPAIAFNTVVTDEVDLEPIIERLLNQPDVATVHVPHMGVTDA